MWKNPQLKRWSKIASALAGRKGHRRTPENTQGQHLTPTNEGSNSLQVTPMRGLAKPFIFLLRSYKDNREELRPDKPGSKNRSQFSRATGWVALMVVTRPTFA
jgi:hypothetical protein